MEANTLQMYEKNKAETGGYLQNKHLHSDIKILSWTSKSLYQMFFILI